MKTLIAIPCGDQVSVDFVRSVLVLQLSGEVNFTWAQGSLVYDARNQLGEKAVTEKFDRVLWLDSDMTFPPDIFERMHKRLDEGIDLVAGLYFSRKQPIRPVEYKTLEVRFKTKWPTPVIEQVDEWGDELQEIAACGFGAVMCTTELIRRVAENYGTPFTPINNLGEDLSFCWKARQLGARLWLDPTIKCGHVGLALYAEETWRAINHKE